MPDPNTVYTASSLPSNDNLNPFSFCVDVQGEMFIRKGKMIAYYGDLKFEAIGSAEYDFLVRKSFGAPGHIRDFVIVTGRGKLILGDGGNNVASYNLEDGNLTVKADHVLGFSPTIVCEECVVPGYLTMLGNGIFLASSNGVVHFMEPPVRVDEDALLGWADMPCPSFRYDYGYVRGLLGAIGAFTGITASGEEKQVNFSGKGTILVQSSEESLLQTQSDLQTLLARVAALGRGDLETVRSTAAQELSRRNQ